ncbi:MAG: carbohydrate porin [Gammaproteobacteria bacterium]|nr:carbohydrate porin [Gammaproteobacteria bacterium]
MALEVTDQFSVGGIMAGIYQHQNLSDAPQFSDTGRGIYSFQPEFWFTPTEQDVLFAKFGFAVGNGLNDPEVSPFLSPPWGGEGEVDLKNINGRDRDTLLEAWYEHTFTLGDDHKLALTGGIIDSAFYLDQNAFSNDQYTQFMNGALINAPNSFFPSFDTGVVVDWDFNNWEITGVIMNVGENDDGNNYNYYGVEIEYNLEATLGQGHYRVVIDTTSKDFLNLQGISLERSQLFLLSVDQELGETYGAWLRLATQSDDPAIDIKNLYSGGIDIKGNLWGRAQDNIGIGYVFANEGNQEIDKYQVFELYVRFMLNEYIASTLDLQYVKQDQKVGDSPSGFIPGVRVTAEF